MTLFRRSLLLGIVIEFLLICSCALGFATSQGDVPNSILMVIVVLHYPFARLTSYLFASLGFYLVPGLSEIIATGIFAVLGWTGLVYFVLFLSKRLFKKRDDHVA